MKPVNKHLPLTKMAGGDLKLYIEHSPHSFDVMVFIATDEKEVVANEVIDIVNNVEGNERGIEYLDPVFAKAIEPPRSGFGASNSGDGYGMEGSEDPIKLLVSIGLTKRSVVAYIVEQPDNTMVLRVLYLLDSITIGTKTPIGYSHTFMPFIGGDLIMQQGFDLTTTDIIDKIKEVLV